LSCSGLIGCENVTFSTAPLSMVSLERMKELRRAIARLLLFWPTALVIGLGRKLISVSETAVGRVTLRPIFRLMARGILYTRSLPIVRPRRQEVLCHETLADIIDEQEEIAVVPCPCRATAPECQHPLHGRHELETCLSFGLVAMLQRISGLGRKLSKAEAKRICRDAVESGQVHHAILTFGMLAEVCNCCVSSCTALAAYHSGVEEMVRPSGLVAIRGEECDGCQEREGRICEEICPYDQGPGATGCVGCGLCACHCPREAIEMGNPIEEGERE